MIRAVVLALALAACSPAIREVNVRLTTADEIDQIDRALNSLAQACEAGFREACGSAVQACKERGVDSPTGCPAFLGCLAAREKTFGHLLAARAAVVEGAARAAIGDAAEASRLASGARSALRAALQVLGDLSSGGK